MSKKHPEVHRKYIKNILMCHQKTKRATKNITPSNINIAQPIHKIYKVRETKSYKQLGP